MTIDKSVQILAPKPANPARAVAERRLIVHQDSIVDISASPAGNWPSQENRQAMHEDAARIDCQTSQGRQYGIGAQKAGWQNPIGQAAPPTARLFAVNLGQARPKMRRRYRDESNRRHDHSGWHIYSGQDHV